MQFGLCCKFHQAPIRYRTYTLKSILQLDRETAKQKINAVVNHNVDALQASFDYCVQHHIRGFRLSSDLIPHHFNLVKHNLLDSEELDRFATKIKQLKPHDLILSMHPGQYVHLGSPHKQVVENSLQGIREHLFWTDLLPLDEINIHIGGTYGNKTESIRRFIDHMQQYLSEAERTKITLENDEMNYSIEDVVSIAEKLHLRAVLDIHHQRAYQTRFPTSQNMESWFLLARSTWQKYPYQRIHFSSPKYDYQNLKNSRPHADFIDITHFPEWLQYYPDVLIDVEAKAKETAIAQLVRDLVHKGWIPRNS